MKGIFFKCIRHKVNVIFNFLRYLRLPNALQGISFLKKMIFNEIFKIGSCPNLKDSSLYERYCIHMYKAGSTRNLQQFSSICDSLIPSTVQFFFDKDIFHEIFQVGACPNLKDSSFYDRFSIHMYKA